MTEQWFRDNMFRLVVDKKFVPAEILKIENDKPIMVKYDDPLFGCDE